MIPHKIKVNQSKQEVPVSSKGYEGMAFTIQGVYYSSNDPGGHALIYDSEGDPITHPIPGDLTPKLLTVEPITTKLPIQIMDSNSGNTIIVYGKLERIVSV